MADGRRAIGSRTGDSKKEVECGICANPPYKARRDYMKATHFPLKHPSKPCKEKGLWVACQSLISTNHLASSFFCRFLTILDFTHICREFVDVPIYALYPESFCVKNPAVRKVFVFSDSGWQWYKRKQFFKNTSIYTCMENTNTLVFIQIYKLTFVLHGPAINTSPTVGAKKCFLKNIHTSY